MSEGIRAMNWERFGKPWLMLVAGLATGLLVGVGMMIGVLVTMKDGRGQLPFPEVALHASASHGSATMAIATGPISSGVEGLFVLDFITGELRCSVLNPKTAQLGGLYRHNVVGDLGIGQGNKKPQYLMVTGVANLRSTGGNMTFAESIVYVADANTGNYVAYMLPWNRTAGQYNFAQTNPMILLGRGSARNIVVE